MSGNTPHPRRLFGRGPRPTLYKYKVYIHRVFGEDTMVQLPVDQIEDAGRQLAVSTLHLMHHLGLKASSIGADYTKDRISGWTLVMLPNDLIAMELLEKATEHVNHEAFTVQVVPQEPI